jgi:predicted metal-dependent HD superfamily phosphohydrolase
MSNPESTVVPLPSEMQAALESAYATPPRAYHNFGHVETLLRHFDEVAAREGWAQPAEVRLAILFHDAIYDARAGDNEASSADLAVESIARWLPDAGIDAARVADLIRLTARHGQLSPGDFAGDPHPDDARRFLDCDMAILAADDGAFDAYDRGIAAEYRHVTRWLYAVNRRRFLKSLLARPRIYLDDGFHARLDAQARHNLRRAVTTKR